MPRRKLSEYRSKKIINSIMGLPYEGWSIVNDTTPEITGAKTYTVKVDQAVKGRFKKGLVLLDIPQAGVDVAVAQLKEKGYTSILVEPYVPHGEITERYLAISIRRDGYWMSYSDKGGVDIESNAESINEVQLDDSTDWEALSEATLLSIDQLHAIFTTVQTQHFSFIEINPYIIQAGKPAILDCAIEVDDAGMFAVKSWSESDLRNPRTEKATAEEDKVRLLDKNSPASFNLSVLNPQGSIFLLLSGGGASVVIADEIYNVGLGKQLANYGEYSGNPNADEAYLYTQQVLSLIDTSNAAEKVLFIGGAAANFTDIADTFDGVIKAIDESADMLRKNNVKVFVRRGGPRQEIGLAKIKEALDTQRILGGVYDPTTSITDALNIALKGIKS